MIYRMRADDIRPYNYMVFYFQVSHYFVSDCPALCQTLFDIPFWLLYNNTWFSKI